MKPLKCKDCENGRSAKAYERDAIPPNGDHGGPLCSITARYEDGTQILFGHEILNKHTLSPAKPSREEIKEKIVQLFMDCIPHRLEPGGTVNFDTERLDEILKMMGGEG